MIKIINYFSIYFHLLIFLIGSSDRFKNCKKTFSNLFLILGPLMKSKKIINRNLQIFSKQESDINEKKS